MQEFVHLIRKVSLEELKSKIEERVYKMLAKLKKNNKTINESVINREEFLEVIEQLNGKSLSVET